jgi:hypothetical protein
MTFASIEAEISDEEFYRVCSEELANIPSYDISDEEKLKLKYTIYDTIIRYEEHKEMRIETERNFKELGESLSQLENSFLCLGEDIGQLYDVAKIAAINTKLAAAKMRDAVTKTKDSVKKIKEYKQETEKIIRGLEDKIDAKDTASDITRNMINQRPQQ